MPRKTQFFSTDFSAGKDKRLLKLEKDRNEQLRKSNQELRDLHKAQIDKISNERKESSPSRLGTKSVSTQFPEQIPPTDINSKETPKKRKIIRRTKK